MTPRFFANPQELRAWFRENHDTAAELWVGYYKKASGIPSIDWPQSVDVALCFGWIDGIRKRHSDNSYKVRFTPRRPKSNWSARNVARMQALIAEGLVQQEGLSAFNNRNPRTEPSASHVRRHARLPGTYEVRIKADRKAWRYLQSARPSYRKQVAFWILSAKTEETRIRRLEILIASSRRGDPIPPLRWSMKGRRPTD